MHTSTELCELEPLHRSGAIQPHGALLVLDPDGRITHVSANIADYLGQSPQHWLGQPGPERLLRLADEIGTELGSRKVFEATLDRPIGPIDVVITRGNDQCCVVELTQHLPSTADVDHTPRLIFDEIPADDDDMAAAHQALTEKIAGFSGFQRVLFYRFREDGDGEVVAEARLDPVYGSYLGLRFPASDVPRIARALYLLNPWRLIPDAAAEPLAILGEQFNPPDLTTSNLRSVSPVHRIYLGNMGVRASISFPIIVGGALTAMVTAHHREACQPSLNQLECISAWVRSHAYQLSIYQSQKRLRMIDGLSRRFGVVRTWLQHHQEIMQAWPQLGNWLLGEFHADGAVLCMGEHCVANGATFEPDAFMAVEDWICKRQGELVWMGDSLIRQIPSYPLSEVAGVLALRVNNFRHRGLRLYLTRTEHIHEVAWGGNPNKPEEYHDGTLGIAPRRSFEKWVEKRLGYSRPWDNEARLLALKLRELLQQEIRF